MGALFLWGLGQGENRLVQSHWIGKPVPAFTLPAAHADRPGLSSQELATGQPRLLNIFASWCIPCRVEAPQLEALAARGVIIDGIAIRDHPADLVRFLAETGNPYRAIGADERSAVQIALGSSGVPETFVVDGNGIIREQIQGVITPEMVPQLVARMEAMQR
ncbi:MAG: DsbE family thiol:disulfide interchange protein [Sphingopyxis sp.]|nr:DsbE family thiol:disulfide interchange protein [Sphingopyxis sp.]